MRLMGPHFVLFVLPGRITRETDVEVTGQTPPPAK